MVEHTLSPDVAALMAQQADTNAKLTEALVALHKSQPPRDVQYGDPDYQASLLKDKREFKTPVFQNGYEADPSGLSDQTLDRVSKLRPGRYLGSVVEVAVNAKGAVYFRYKNKMPDQRMTLPFRSFTELVDLIWAEMQTRTVAA